MKINKREGNLPLKEKGKSLVKRYAIGNVCLQIGRFVTREEKEDRKKKVLSRRFV